MHALKALFTVTLLIAFGIMAMQILDGKSSTAVMRTQSMQVAAPVVPVALPQPVLTDLVDLAPGQWRCEFYGNRDLLGAPVLTQTLPALKLNWGMRQPTGLPKADDFSARCRSKHSVPILSVYDLHVVADDGVRILVDQVTVLDGWRNGRQNDAAQVPLQAGMHEFQVDYFDASGPARLALDIREGCDAWTGRYYPSPNFEGVPALISCDGAAQGPLVFDIGDGFPKFMDGAETFSVLWEQSVRFAQSGTYQFQIEAYDGAEVYIGADRVYGRLADSIGLDTFTAKVSAGRQLVQVRYADRGGAARFKMSWVRVE